MNKLQGPRPILAGLTVVAIGAAAYLTLAANPAEPQVRSSKVASKRIPHPSSTVNGKPRRPKPTRPEVAHDKHPRRTREQIAQTGTTRKRWRPKPTISKKKKRIPPS